MTTYKKDDRVRVTMVGSATSSTATVLKVRRKRGEVLYEVRADRALFPCTCGQCDTSTMMVPAERLKPLEAGDLN